MAATNANAQMILQLLQERTQGQGNQGNQGQGNNQPHFATLNQFLANQNQDPPPPPPPPEAWQAVMAATNANTQLIMQILQEHNKGNQGNQGNNQNHFATLNQFLANGPKTFSNCIEATG